MTWWVHKFTGKKLNEHFLHTRAEKGYFEFLLTIVCLIFLCLWIYVIANIICIILYFKQKYLLLCTGEKLGFAPWRKMEGVWQQFDNSIEEDSGQKKRNEKFYMYSPSNNRARAQRKIFFVGHFLTCYYPNWIMPITFVGLCRSSRGFDLYFRTSRQFLCKENEIFLKYYYLSIQHNGNLSSRCPISSLIS
jgi:hypothetical protein